jgi:hypothetical protein
VSWCVPSRRRRPTCLEHVHIGGVVDSGFHKPLRD